MPFNLFRKKKTARTRKTSCPPQEEPKQETLSRSISRTDKTRNSRLQSRNYTATTEPAVEEPAQNRCPVAPEQKQEAAEPLSKTYLKAMPLKELSDLENIKKEVKNGNIIIFRVTPLATKSIEDVKTLLINFMSLLNPSAATSPV